MHLKNSAWGLHAASGKVFCGLQTLKKYNFLNCCGVPALFVNFFQLALKIMIKKQTKNKYSQTCVQRPPLGPEKTGRLKERPDKSESMTGR